MFELLIGVLLLWTALPAGGFALGKAMPKLAIAAAGVVISLLSFLWWLALRDGIDGPAAAMGLAILMGLSTCPVLFVFGLAAGVLCRPPVVVGAWVGALAAAILVACPPAGVLPGIAPLVFVACCAAGVLWNRNNCAKPSG
ncbi:MAG TPA: hypothetical protein VFY73_02815 [Ideonella sp.]|uniref:hypothetical protein n=1 Tax=Ideonella sp. TaxID=1929293 RepID=UPI002E30A8A5|nr:hypothetical protein [Ideonella sp.]HEX5682944.1 hypothetical protein [Ideonella sp.]